MGKQRPHQLLVALSILLFPVVLEILSFGGGIFLHWHGRIYGPQVTDSYAT